jgi:Rrf2 family protein
MRLSAQEEYGLRCLLQVARHAGDGPVQIVQIAAFEGLSPEYVAKLMRVLRQGGLVVSSRGAAGGYRLARPPAEITLNEAIHALDGPMFPSGFCDTHVGQADRCVHATGCSIRVLWRRVDAALDRILGQITLADLGEGLPEAP